MAIRKKRQAGSAAQRALEILEAVATARRPVTGNEIMAWVKLPKPTVYRTCSLLETMGMVQREADSKKLTVGPRLCALALEVMLSSPNRGPIRAVLQSLASAIGETCTFTILDGNEVVVVDRVESAEPLRLELHAGSRIPLHCTASGKLLLALQPKAARARLLAYLVLTRFTDTTLTDAKRLGAELAAIRTRRYATDNEEYHAGLVCVAVPVSDARGRACAAIAVQAPVSRMPLERALQHLSGLRRAADAMAATFTQ